MSEYGEAVPAEDTRFKELLPPEKAAAYDMSLDALESELGLAPGLTDGLKSPALSLYMTGLPETDRVTMAIALEQNNSVISGLLENLPQLRNKNFLPAQNRAERRRKNSFTLMNPGTKGVYEKYGQYLEHGCSYETAVKQATFSNHLTYAKKVSEFVAVPMKYDMAICVEPGDLVTLVGNGQSINDVTDEQIIKRSREVCIPDHTSEMLDKRFELFVSLAQMQLLHHTSIDLLMLACMGGRAKAGYAREFLQKHEPILLADDLPGKFEAYKELARGARGFMHHEQNQNAAKFLKRMSGAARHFAESLEDEVSGFTEVYEYFGYQKPALLQSKPGEIVALEPEHTEPALEGKLGSLAMDEVVIETVFQKLDQFVLPPDASIADIDQELTRIGIDEASVNKVQWQRLRDLVTICGQFEQSNLYRSKDHSLGGAPPYFVAEIMHNGEKYAVAESPVFGNATYVIAEKHVPGTWQEVLELSKANAVGVGASRVRHTTNAPYGPSHIRKVVDTLFDFHVTEGLA